MKYNFIYRLKKNEQGAGLVPIYMSKTYRQFFSAYNEDNIDVKLIDNRIWQLQNPFLYKSSMIDRLNDFMFLRKDYALFFQNKRILTNGFSYYKDNSDIYATWFPTIYQSNFGINDMPSIGYYAREVRHQSNIAFCDFIKTIPSNVPIVTMGDKSLIEKQLYSNKYWKHTYDNDVFWRSCSHYFYYQCSDRIDPFPDTLLEAIQSNHRIISPKNLNRSHQDGIDDLLSCIEYDKTFKPCIFNKHYDCLDSIFWEKIIEQLVDSNFKIRPKIDQKMTLYDFICTI